MRHDDLQRANRVRLHAYGICPRTLCLEKLFKAKFRLEKITEYMCVAAPEQLGIFHSDTV